MPDQSAAWVAASRLVRRTGFGSTGPVVDQVLAQGPAAYLQHALDDDPALDPGSAATPAPELTLPTGPKKKMSDEQKKQLRNERALLTGWWLQRMTAVNIPLPEKLTFCWHNHFATSLAKVKIPALMLQQNETLRAQGRGDFRTLALSMLTDPAMLRWLDGQKNTKGSANENLSREWMELFTLGHGHGYTEADVREGAKALTGWVIAPDGTAQLVPKRHDAGPKTVLGVTSDLDATGFCDAVLAQPGSAPFVAARLWSQLVSGPPATQDTQRQLLSAYGEGRDLRALFARLLGGPELATAQGSIVASPVEWMVGAYRALGVPTDAPAKLAKTAKTLQTLGQVPFYPPSVGGWPSGQAWLSTAAVQTRLEFGATLAGAGDLSTVSDAGASERTAAVAYLLGIGGWSDRSAAALATAKGDPATLVAIGLNTAEYLVH